MNKINEENIEENIGEEEKQEVLEHIASLKRAKKKREEEMINPFMRKKIASIKKLKKARKQKPFPIITTTHDILRQQEDVEQKKLNKILGDDDEKENNYYDAINMLASHFGHKPVKAFYMPYRYHILRMLLIASKRSNVNAHRNYSSNKLFSLGFKKSIQFREGIRRFATWYRQSMFQNRL